MTALFARDKTPDLTAYDFLKTFALITMVIDHLGAFLFPDLLMLKAIGRWSFPVWLFLVGYSNTRTIPKRLWGAAILITLSYIVFHRDPLPLNILATIIVARLLLPFITRPFFYTALGVVVLLGLCLAVYFPSYAYVEYGVTGLMFAFWGHLRRVDPCSKWLQDVYAMVLFLLHVGVQILIYPFSTSQEKVVLVGMAVTMFALHYFKPTTYSQTQNNIFAPFLRFCGRYTLEIYTVHIIAFTIISAYLYGEFQHIDIWGLSMDIPAGGFTRK